MTKRLVECVPNFSEGRDPEVIESIRNSIIEDGTCEVWNYSSDHDHNRSVFTIAGSPEDIGNAVIRFTAKAAKLINMEVHEGVHPCIGATDVVPFVPLLNTSMEECIELAEKTGLRIAKELSLPVFLYAKAAKRPEHQRLSDIRRGGYRTLRDEIGSFQERMPDFGPHLMGTAGGVSIGARDFLIAFNVFLDSVDTHPAKEIARRIRTSSGGLPALQAIGLSVNGYAQVSMNLLDYRVTSLKKVFSAISCLADELKTGILYSELIGMLPESALADISPEELLIKDFNSDRILETHLKKYL